MNRVIVSLFASLIPLSAALADEDTGAISSAWLARDNMLVFGLEGDIDKSRCAVTPNKVINTDNDAGRRMANVVVAAFASGRELYVRGWDDCVLVRGAMVGPTSGVHLELVEIVQPASRGSRRKKK